MHEVDWRRLLKYLKDGDIMKLIVNHFKLMIMNKRFTYGIIIAMLFAFIFNVAQYIEYGGNISQAGGVFETSLVLAHSLYGNQFLIITTIPLLITFFIIDPIYNEKELNTILYTKMGKHQFLISRLVSTFLLAFLLYFSFYAVLVLTNNIIFGTQYLGTDTFASYPLSMYNQFHTKWGATTLILPYSVMTHPSFVSLVYGVLTSLYAAAIGVFTYGLSLNVKRYLLIYIIPFVLAYVYRLIFSASFLFDFAIENILIAWYNCLYPYCWIGFAVWFFSLILLGILFTYIYTKRSEG